MIRYKFSKSINKEFSNTLKLRVNEYFKDNNLSRNANSLMTIKSVMALSIYLIPYSLIIFGGFTSLPLLFGLWMIMGLGMSFIGTGIMHDALHGSYSKNPSLNNLIGFCTLIVGVDPRIWQLQHNVLHHTYTNIEHADEDIEPRKVLRMSPNQDYYKFHKFQFLYAPLFYSIFTLVWVFYKDYYKVYSYRRKGLIKTKDEFNGLLRQIISRKIFYYLTIIALPMYVIDLPFWQVFLMFMSMHMVSGLFLALVFQTAHVMPTTKFFDLKDEVIEENWMVHQLLTTTNFAPKNKILTWFLGGLNYQVEHHLFPNICHIHYPKLSEVIKKTVVEYNLPYNSEKSFTSAILSHFKMLKSLGERATA